MLARADPVHENEVTSSPTVSEACITICHAVCPAVKTTVEGEMEAEPNVTADPVRLATIVNVWPTGIGVDREPTIVEIEPTGSSVGTGVDREATPLGITLLVEVQVSQPAVLGETLRTPTPGFAKVVVND